MIDRLQAGLAIADVRAVLGHRRGATSKSLEQTATRICPQHSLSRWQLQRTAEISDSEQSSDVGLRANETDPYGPARQRLDLVETMPGDDIDELMKWTDESRRSESTAWSTSTTFYGDGVGKAILGGPDIRAVPAYESPTLSLN